MYNRMIFRGIRTLTSEVAFGVRLYTTFPGFGGTVVCCIHPKIGSQSAVAASKPQLWELSSLGCCKHSLEFGSGTWNRTMTFRLSGERTDHYTILLELAPNTRFELAANASTVRPHSQMSHQALFLLGHVLYPCLGNVTAFLFCVIQALLYHMLAHYDINRKIYPTLPSHHVWKLIPGEVRAAILWIKEHRHLVTHDCVAGKRDLRFLR